MRKRFPEGAIKGDEGQVRRRGMVFPHGRGNPQVLSLLCGGRRDEESQSETREGGPERSARQAHLAGNSGDLPAKGGNARHLVEEGRGGTKKGRPMNKEQRAGDLSLTETEGGEKPRGEGAGQVERGPVCSSESKIPDVELCSGGRLRETTQKPEFICEQKQRRKGQVFSPRARKVPAYLGRRRPEMSVL